MTQEEIDALATSMARCSLLPAFDAQAVADVLLQQIGASAALLPENAVRVLIGVAAMLRREQLSGAAPANLVTARALDRAMAR